ncbi:MAG TPA: phospholipase [Microvirga sp.]|jgi:phospholipase/carboxylesterase|nr:phospholipase [Microvirga sp.]
MSQTRHAARGLLAARPAGGPKRRPATRGLAALGLGGARDAVLHVPQRYEPARPAPLLVLLHGAGGGGRQLVDLFIEAAEARGVLILSPDSRGRTWDVILGGFGADVAFIDRALGLVFERYAVDPARIAVGGFSDGASYALSIGVGNGGLFGHVLAFSPGFAAPVETHGSPRIFVSHGVADAVLPIDPCSRRLVPALRQAGYDVDYREFDGGHTVPPEMITAAMARFLA